MTRRDRTELAALLGVSEGELGDYVPRFNIAPTQPYFVLKSQIPRWIQAALVMRMAWRW